MWYNMYLGILENKFLAKRLYYVLVIFKVVYVCVCVRVWERERERARGREGGRERETEILTDSFDFP